MPAPVGARHASPLRTVGRRPSPGTSSLSAIVGSFKSATSRRTNLLRGTHGAPVWQRGFQEHVIRDEEDLDESGSTSRRIRFVGRTVMENPDRRFPYGRRMPSRTPSGPPGFAGTNGASPLRMIGRHLEPLEQGHPGPLRGWSRCVGVEDASSSCGAPAVRPWSVGCAGNAGRGRACVRVRLAGSHGAGTRAWRAPG